MATNFISSKTIDNPGAATYSYTVPPERSEGDCKENGPLTQLLWILVFDDQHNQIGLMCLLVFIL